MTKKQCEISGLKIGFGQPVRLMAVLNLSPESFYRPSVTQTYQMTKQRILRFIEEKADIIDLGPKSTAPVDIYGRPTFITPEEEIARLKIPLEIISELNPSVLISIDTQSSVVAEYGLKNGAHIINDISGFKDPKMPEIIARHDAGCVIMPAKEKPGDIYQMAQIIEFFRQAVAKAEQAGMDITKIIIDPGIGGWVSERTPKNDYDIIKSLSQLKVLELPILVAISRKSFIGSVLGAPPENRLYGSLAATAIAVQNGADVVRTHDIKETLDAVRIAEQFR